MFPWFGASNAICETAQACVSLDEHVKYRRLMKTFMFWQVGWTEKCSTVSQKLGTFKVRSTFLVEGSETGNQRVERSCREPSHTQLKFQQAQAVLLGGYPCWVVVSWRNFVATHGAPKTIRASNSKVFFFLMGIIYMVPVGGRLPPQWYGPLGRAQLPPPCNIVLGTCLHNAWQGAYHVTCSP